MGSAQSIALSVLMLLVLVGCAGGRSAHDFSTLTNTAEQLVSPMRANVLTTAQALLGIPYRYGGMTPEGFDCSGFIYYVYRKATGIALPRVSHEQVERGKSIALSSLRPADLVYFKIGRNTTHIGIYIGQGRFIHAPSSGGRVNIQHLNTDYWTTRYAGARRIL